MYLIAKLYEDNDMDNLESSLYSHHFLLTCDAP